MINRKQACRVFCTGRQLLPTRVLLPLCAASANRTLSVSCLKVFFLTVFVAENSCSSSRFLPLSFLLLGSCAASAARTLVVFLKFLLGTIVFLTVCVPQNHRASELCTDSFPGYISVVSILLLPELCRCREL